MRVGYFGVRPEAGGDPSWPTDDPLPIFREPAPTDDAVLTVEEELARRGAPADVSPIIIRAQEAQAARAANEAAREKSVWAALLIAGAGAALFL